MISYTFRPLTTWPQARTAKRSNADFSVPFDRVWKYLASELNHLGVTGQAVVEAAFREQDLTMDGSRPRSDAPAPSFPGVVISAHTKFGPMKWPCDRFSRWQDNVRAISLALQRLREIDRYGISARGEQYTGWKALPGAIVTPAAMSVEEAARFVAMWGGDRVDYFVFAKTSKQGLDGLYRKAALRLHPDTYGGKTRPEWHQLQQAKDILDRHFANKGV